MKAWRGDGWEIRCGRWQDDVRGSTLFTAGDCRSGGSWENCQIDAVISDPPYDERTHRTARLSGSQYGGRNGGSGKVVKAPDISFGAIHPADVGPPLVSLSNRWVVLFCAAEQLGAYQEAAGDAYIRGGAWIKNNPKPQFSGDRPGQGLDGIAILHRKGRKRWNRGGHCAIWRATAPIGRGSELRLHETEKPVSLMLDLISDFTEPGELVWDPYCGSGTTGVACLRMGRSFIGHEMQPHYAEAAAERLAAETRGLTLKDARAGQTSILDMIPPVGCD